jgi:hypothetical protein
MASPSSCAEVVRSGTAWWVTCYLPFSGKDVWAAAIDAADDPAVVELQALGARNAKEWLRPIVAGLAKSKLLAHGLTQREAVDCAWMLCGMDSYFRATRGLGWNDDHYERWLERILQLQLIGTAD